MWRPCCIMPLAVLDRTRSIVPSGVVLKLKAMEGRLEFGDPRSDMFSGGVEGGDVSGEELFVDWFSCATRLLCSSIDSMFEFQGSKSIGDKGSLFCCRDLLVCIGINNRLEILLQFTQGEQGS